MRARTPISNELKKRLLVEQEKMMYRVIRRFTKMVCITLNEQFGFGEKRLQLFMAQFSRVGGLAEHDEEYWYHVDERLRQLGLEFQPEEADELKLEQELKCK